MEITRNVLLDLLPLYLAGEVSDDTRALVDHHLTQDPALARLAREAARTGLPDLPRPAGPSVEMKAFLKTKRLMLRHNLTLGLAIVFTLFFAIAMGFLLETYPEAGAISFLLGAVFWVVYGLTGRRLARLSE